jgi:hypothetical protein
MTWHLGARAVDELTLPQRAYDHLAARDGSLAAAVHADHHVVTVTNLANVADTSVTATHFISGAQLHARC